jgi:hypothetical protein
MEEQKPNYSIVLYNFLIFFGYMIVGFGLLSLYFLVAHLLILLVLSLIFFIQNNRALAGMFFLSFWVIFLICFSTCALLFFGLRR